MNEPRSYSTAEQEQIVRFVRALNHAMVSSHGSQRDLAKRLEVSLGTVTKYLRGSVPPLKVCLEIQARIAEVLGVTIDALYHYYQDGEYVTSVDLQTVASWIRSDSGQEAIPVLMQSIQEAYQRWAPAAQLPAVAEVKALGPAPWMWPAEELEDAGLTERLRERLTLTPERVEALVRDGQFDDDLIEGFACACNYDIEAVRESFERRRPIA